MSTMAAPNNLLARLKARLFSVAWMCSANIGVRRLSWVWPMADSLAAVAAQLATTRDLSAAIGVTTAGSDATTVPCASTM